VAVVRNRRDRAASFQNLQVTSGAVWDGFDPQHDSATAGILCCVDPQHVFGAGGATAADSDSQHEADGPDAMRSAAKASNQPTRMSNIVPKPLSIPIPTAEIILATANPVPSVPAAMKNCVGSMSGDEIQNAITGASGTPAPSSPATSGIGALRP
jgi:hypothetical protein